MALNLSADNFFNPQRRRTYQRILLLALVLSILLNAGFLLIMRRVFVWAPIATAPRLLLTPYDEKEKKDERQSWAFTLAETPESARRMKPPEKASHISDKNAVAQNPEAPPNLPLGEPFANGVARAADTAPMPELQAGKTPAATGPEITDELVSSRIEAVRPTNGAPSNFRREFLTGETENNSRWPYASRYQPGLQNSDSRAPELGSFSLNTYAWEYAPYLLWLKDRVQRNIYPPPAFTQMGIISGRTILRFRITRTGVLQNLTLLGYEGHKSLMETSLRAIQTSAPFRNLPKDFPEPYLEVTAQFEYTVYR